MICASGGYGFVFAAAKELRKCKRTPGQGYHVFVKTKVLIRHGYKTLHEKISDRDGEGSL